MSVLLLLGLSLASPCELNVPASARFEVNAPQNAEHVQLLIELWAHPGDDVWLDAMLGELESRGLRGAVLLPVPNETTEPGALALAARAARGAHEVGVVFTESEVPLDSQAPRGPMKQRLKPLRKAAGGVKLVATPLPSRAAEALMGATGFRTLLQQKGPATSIPRPSVVFEGQPRIGVVLQAGPYAGPCGVKPEADPFTPASADRATQALWGAARIDGVPVLRVVIPTGVDTDGDRTVLGRWLDEVLLPVGVRPTTPNSARNAVLAYFRTGRIMDGNRLEGGGGRLVSVAEVRAAAEALADENILPRTLPGGLNLTEAFLSFALLLAEQNEGEVIRLAALQGPRNQTRSTVEGIVELDHDAVVAMARSLVAELPAAVPTGLPVGGKTLNAPELLTALASAVRGQAKTWPTASPEPNAAGQGWGDASLP